MLIDLVRKKNNTLIGFNRDLAVQRFLMCRPSGRVSFADTLILAAASSGGWDVMPVTFTPGRQLTLCSIPPSITTLVPVI